MPHLVDMLKGRITKKGAFIIQFILIFAGFSSLLKVSSEHLDGIVYLEDFSNYYVPYLLCFALGMCSLVYNYFSDGCRIEDRRERIIVYSFTLLFSLMITCANYTLYTLPAAEYAGYPFRIIYRLIYMVTVLAGSMCAFYNIFVSIQGMFFLWKPSDRSPEPVKVFITVFLLIVVLDTAILVLCKYPGNLVTDSYNQIYQAAGDFEYSNHHPFYHTMVIKLFLNAGIKVFHNYNAAVALYTCFQILFMAVCFAYGVMLTAQLKAPGWTVAVIAVIYAVAPYHIMYALTMTKDVMFGGFMLVAVVSVLRVIKGIGRFTFNMLLTAVSGLGVCLFRSNGLFAFVLWMISLIFIYRKALKTDTLPVIRKLLVCMAAVIVIASVMKHPLLKIFNVHQTDFIESLSIPLQQIGRTLRDHDDLAADEEQLLSRVMEVDKIRDTYYHTSSDPLKERIRAEGNEEYLVSHKAEFLRLYVGLFLSHPDSYLAAWIDQTYGYWNAGYREVHWFDCVTPGIFDNRYDIHRTVMSETLNNAFNEYLYLYEEVPLLQLFLCIGLHTWALLLLLYVSFIKKDREGMTTLSPLIWMIVSLMIATPLSMEFRYDYAVFCVLPVITVIVLRRDPEESQPE